jgi:hypothetical protein
MFSSLKRRGLVNPGSPGSRSKKQLSAVSFQVVRAGALQFAAAHSN